MSLFVMHMNRKNRLNNLERENILYDLSMYPLDNKRI